MAVEKEEEESGADCEVPGWDVFLFCQRGDHLGQVVWEPTSPIHFNPFFLCPLFTLFRDWSPSEQVRLVEPPRVSVLVFSGRPATTP